LLADLWIGPRDLGDEEIAEFHIGLLSMDCVVWPVLAESTKEKRQNPLSEYALTRLCPFGDDLSSACRSAPVGRRFFEGKTISTRAGEGAVAYYV
jgi:hypothetical protein